MRFDVLFPKGNGNSLEANEACFEAFWRLGVFFYCQLGEPWYFYAMKKPASTEKSRKPLLILGIAFLVGAGALSVASLAWFAAPKTQVDSNSISGIGTASYFDGGDGSEGDPYQIRTAKQLYYFNWLQDLGYFNRYKKDTSGSDTTEIDQTYFVLTDNIDASGFVLPPAGTKTYPFLGNFNGAGYTISNLSISNSTSKLSQSGIPKGAQTSDGLLSNAEIVGFFGIVGQWGNSTSYTFSSDANNVKDLYFDKLLVDSNASTTLSGLLAGYVNGNMSHCGVRAGKLTYATGASPIKDSTFGSDNTKLSKYSLIGDYNEDNFTWEGKGGTSSDTGYGTSTDIRALYDEMARLNLLDGTTGVISSSTALPFKTSDDTALSGGTGSKTITTYGRSLNISYSKSISVADGATNIGYYSGPEIKTYKDYFAKTKVSDDYEIDYDNITVASLSSVKTVDENIKEYLTTNIDELTRKGDSALVLSGTNYLDTSTLGVKGGYNLVENAKVGNYEGDLLIPYRSVWVAPITPGKFQMIIVNKDKQNARLAVWKVQRNTPKDYSTGFVNAYYDSTVVGVQIPAYSGSGAYIPYYYGVEVTQDDIDKGYEFVITKYIAGANVYITYIDVGANGGDSGEVPEVVPTIDFVYYKTNTTEIFKIDDEGYTNSKVTFALTSGVTSVCFWRVNDNGTISMYYYTASTTLITKEGNGSATLGKEEDYTSN